MKCTFGVQNLGHWLLKLNTLQQKWMHLGQSEEILWLRHPILIQITLNNSSALFITLLLLNNCYKNRIIRLNVSLNNILFIGSDVFF